MFAPFAQALAVKYLVKCLQQHTLELSSLCTPLLSTAPLSNRGFSWLQRKPSSNPLKGRFSPKCKQHSVLTTTCCWFSLPNSRPQTHPFPQPCTSHPLHSTRNVHCNLLWAFICCQHHSSWELCFVCSAWLVFCFVWAWAVVSWHTVVCICAQSPTAATAGWLYRDQRLCTAAQTVLTYMEQFIHLEKVIDLVRKKRQTQYFQGQWRGSSVRHCQTLLTTSFIYMLLPLCNIKVVCDANSPSPSCTAEQPQSSWYGKEHENNFYCLVDDCGMLYLITR